MKSQYKIKQNKKSIFKEAQQKQQKQQKQEGPILVIFYY